MTDPFGIGPAGEGPLGPIGEMLKENGTRPPAGDTMRRGNHHHRLDPFWLWVAKHLPRRLVYWCFLRVHGESEIWWSFNDVAEQWHRTHDEKVRAVDARRAALRGRCGAVYGPGYRCTLFAGHAGLHETREETDAEEGRAEAVSRGEEEGAQQEADGRLRVWHAQQAEVEEALMFIEFTIVETLQRAWVRVDQVIAVIGNADARLVELMLPGGTLSVVQDPNQPVIDLVRDARSAVVR